jgi:hypothetical protein
MVFASILHLIRRVRCAGCWKIPHGSQQDRLHELVGAGRPPIASSSRRINPRRPGVLVRDTVGRSIAAFSSRTDRSLEPAAQGSYDPDGHAAKFLQRPLILGDKWDF